MAKNFVQRGDYVTMIAPSGGVKSGDPVLIGATFGVAMTDALEGAEFETAVTGVWDLPSAGAIGAGAAVYYDVSEKKITATSTGNILVGVCLIANGSGATVAP